MISIPSVSHTTLIVCALFLVTIWFFNSFGYKNNTNDECNSKSNLIIKKMTTERVSKFTESEIKLIENAKKCFQFKSNKNLDIELLDDIMESENKPKPGQSIFFHVTTCATDGRVNLNARQACAVESTAIHNPNRQIFILFAAPVGFAKNEPKSPIIAALQSYSNIFFRNMNLYTYSDQTPAENWTKTDTIFLSKYLVSHMSDYLRFLTLFKFGGTYLDLDLIIKRNFDDMPPNYAGAETSKAIAVGAIGLDADYIGHKIAEFAVKENTENYKPNEWGYNGPGVMTRILHKICHRKYIVEFQPEFCWGFKVFPPNTFYAIPWKQWEQYFDTNPAIVNRTLELIKDSIAIHVWNKVSSKRKIIKSQLRTVYGTLAQQHCPNAYAASGLYF